MHPAAYYVRKGKPLARRHNCRRCQRPIEACQCGDDIGRAERDAGLLPLSLSINSPETPLGLGGYDRPVELIENADEIVARFRENAQPQLICAYCREKHRTRDPADALAWFRSHACSGEGVDIDKWLAA